MDAEIVVEFGLGGNGVEVTKTGWSNPEPNFCWMVGLESVALLPSPVPAARYQLALDVQATCPASATAEADADCRD